MGRGNGRVRYCRGAALSLSEPAWRAIFHHFLTFISEGGLQDHDDGNGLARSASTHRREVLGLAAVGEGAGPVVSEVVHAQLGHRGGPGTVTRMQPRGSSRRHRRRRLGPSGGLDPAIVAAAVVLGGPPPLEDGPGDQERVRRQRASVAPHRGGAGEGLESLRDVQGVGPRDPVPARPLRRDGAPSESADSKRAGGVRMARAGGGRECRVFARQSSTPQ